MRFGISGAFLPDDMDDLTPEHLRRTRALGFSGIFARFRRNDPRTTRREQAERVRQMLADENVRLFQATGFWQNLVTPDEARRADAVQTLCAAIRLASWLGARGVDTGPGSMSPDGVWFPHPYNWTPEARRQLTKSLREAAPAAEDAGVYLSVEGHQLVTLASAEITAAILDEVDSPWVKSDYDSANWIALHEVYDTGAALDRHFAALGRHIVSCHAKDIWVENRLAVHLQDGAPGKGTMDFRTLFRHMQALNPDFPVIVEGADTDDLPAVGQLFHQIASELGLRVLDAHEQPSAVRP
jgi:sugar phosphate isomerase/epimerase